ncbi:retrovirus-related pol polyprotein from transposon TNT 1-94 [Tanacetum coccineum]
MDSMIPTGQKNTLTEYMILSGADNCPPMLDKDLIKKYAELSSTEKIQDDYDMKAINIILQGLPTDIYSLMNHHRVAKDLWEKVQLLMQGTSLTKQERECKLYDAFDKFTHIKGESLHLYYLRFTQLINDMNIYNMKLEQFHGRQNSYAAGTSRTRANTSETGRTYSSQQRIVKCFNCQGEGHMARQCPKPKRKRDATWFREKVLLVEAQGNGKVLIEEELEFLADPGITEDLYSQSSSYGQLSSYGSDVLFEVAIYNNTNNDMLNKSVQEMPYSEPYHFVEHSENEIHSDSNIILYSKYLIESQTAAVQDTNSSAQHDALILFVFEQLSNQLNRLSKDFGKRFIPQRELSVEQALHPIINQSASSPVKIEAPRKLPKMEVVVQQYHIDKQCFEIQKKQFLFENDRLLDQFISQDIMNIVVNSSVDPNTSVNVNSYVAMIESVNYVEICNKCLKLEAELIKQHNMVEKDEYNRLSKRFSKLEQHCISLEIAIQLNKEIFQKNNTSVNQTEPSFDQLFKLNNLKAELQAKDTKIKKLKAHIKRVNETSTSESVKKDLDETETINIELEHREKVFVITTLKNDLRKLKRKDKVDNAAQMSNATTMAPGMYKLDPIILAPQVKNNRESHEYYLKHTMEQAAILREGSCSRKEWKPTRKIFNSVGYKWKPTGRTLTLVGNACPLTRITTTNQVPLRVPIPLEVVTPEHVVTRVYTRRPKVPKFVPNRKPKVAKSMTANRMEPDTSRGSDTSVAPSSSSLIDCRLPKLFCGKSKKQSHKPKSEDTNQEKLYLLHMDLCGPMRVASVNRKKYILVIVDDYSRFTWVKFLASKDEALDFIIKFLKMIQLRLNAAVRNIRTDNGTEFVNQTLRDYYEQVGISHETSVARTLQQTGSFERRNRTLVEAARTMLIYAKAPLFLWAEAVATACIFIRYAPKKKAYRIYNQRTRKIIETIHVDFDELTAMASEQSSLEPALHEMTPATPSSGLVPNHPPSVPFVPPSRHEWDLMFQPVFEIFSLPASVASPVPVEKL